MGDRELHKARGKAEVTWLPPIKHLGSSHLPGL